MTPHASRIPVSGGVYGLSESELSVPGTGHLRECERERGRPDDSVAADDPEAAQWNSMLGSDGRERVKVGRCAGEHEARLSLPKQDRIQPRSLSRRLGLSKQIVK